MATTTMTKTVTPMNPNAIGKPKTDGQAIDIYDLIGQHMASKLASSQSPTDVSAIASALGRGNASNTPLGVSPDALFGLMPEQVQQVATTRADMEYKKMLSNIGALDFTQNLQGTKENRALTNTVVAGEQERQRQLEITNMSKQMNERMVKIQADAQKDPTKMAKLGVAQRIMAGDKTVTPIEKEFAMELFGPKDISPADAGKFLSSYYTYKSVMPELAAQMEPYVGFYQGALDRASKSEVLGKSGKKDFGMAIATDALGKSVFMNDGKYVYEDGTEYKPAKKGK